MNVFVETNFTLELALEQQESSSCEAILRLAEDRTIRLLVPAYSFVEPHETLKRRHLERRELRSRISRELAQLGRTAPLNERAAASREMIKLLTDSIDYEIREIERVKSRLIKTAEILSFDAAAVADASLFQLRFALSPQDAAVYASIRSGLVIDTTVPRCFISRNPKDFDSPNLRKDLDSLNCKYFPSFAKAKQFIKHAVA